MRAGYLNATVDLASLYNVETPEESRFCSKTNLCCSVASVSYCPNVGSGAGQLSKS